MDTWQGPLFQKRRCSYGPYQGDRGPGLTPYPLPSLQGPLPLKAVAPSPKPCWPLSFLPYAPLPAVPLIPSTRPRGCPTVLANFKGLVHHLLGRSPRLSRLLFHI